MYKLKSQTLCKKLFTYRLLKIQKSLLGNAQMGLEDECRSLEAAVLNC